MDDSKIIYLADCFGANKFLKNILERLRNDEIDIFIFACVDVEGNVGYCWFSEKPKYQALGLVARMEHKINSIMDQQEIIEKTEKFIINEQLYQV